MRILASNQMDRTVQINGTGALPPGWREDVPEKETFWWILNATVSNHRRKDLPSISPALFV
jgi:hypothetical protein